MAQGDEKPVKAGKKQSYKVLRNIWNGTSEADMIRKGTVLKLTEEEATRFPAGALEGEEAAVELEVATPTPPAPPPQK